MSERNSEPDPRRCDVAEVPSADIVLAQPLSPDVTEPRREIREWPLLAPLFSCWTGNAGLLEWPRAGALRRQGDFFVTTMLLSRRSLSAMQFQPSPNDLSRNRPP